MYAFNSVMLYQSCYQGFSEGRKVSGFNYYNNVHSDLSKNSAQLTMPSKSPKKHKK